MDSRFNLLCDVCCQVSDKVRKVGGGAPGWDRALVKRKHIYQVCTRELSSYRNLAGRGGTREWDVWNWETWATSVDKWCLMPGNWKVLVEFLDWLICSFLPLPVSVLSWNVNSLSSLLIAEGRAWMKWGRTKIEKLFRSSMYLFLDQYLGTSIFFLFFHIFYWCIISVHINGVCYYMFTYAHNITI